MVMERSGRLDGPIAITLTVPKYLSATPGCLILPGYQRAFLDQSYAVSVSSYQSFQSFPSKITSPIKTAIHIFLASLPHLLGARRYLPLASHPLSASVSASRAGNRPAVMITQSQYGERDDTTVQPGDASTTASESIERTT